MEMSNIELFKVNTRRIFSLLANGCKLMAWPGVVFFVVVVVVGVVNNFFQPLLLRNYCTDFFEIWYGASLGRGL